MTLSQPHAQINHSSFSILRVFLLPAQTLPSFQNCPRESLWLTKLEDQRMWWITPCGFYLGCKYRVHLCPGLFDVSLHLHKHSSFFPPLNHLRVKSLSSRSSPINVANMTHHIPLPGTTDQRPGPSVWAPEIAGWLGLPCHPAGQLQALTQVFETCLPVW